jgi:hypothetical protein
MFVVVFLILASMVSAQEIQKIFAVHLTVYRNDTVVLQSLIIDNGKVSDFLDINSKYTVKTVSFNGNILFEKPVSINFFTYPFGKETILLNERDVYLKIPFSPDTEKIQLYHENKTIFEIDTKPYLCIQNNLCSGFENALNCPEDCKHDYNLIYIILALLIVLLVYVVYRWINKRMTEERILKRLR